MIERKLFAVAGRPVLHSLSPVLFRSAYTEEPGPAHYTRLSASSPEEALRIGLDLGLAGLLGWPFQDSDEWIERKAGRSVPEIFRSEGEAFFRNLETEALRELLAGRAGVVCACGGGSMQSGANRAVVTGHSVVVWLHATPAPCRARVDASTRPLLDPRSMTEEAFGELFRTRISCYVEVADVVVGSETEADRTARIIHEEIRRVIAD